MQFYRKWIPYTELTYPGENNKGIPFFRDCGFIKVNGNDIDDDYCRQTNWIDSGANGMKWKYDADITSSTPGFALVHNTDSAYSYYRYYGILPNNTSTTKYAQGITYYTGVNDINACLFFPLKNRGFLFNWYNGSNNSLYKWDSGITMNNFNFSVAPQIFSPNQCVKNVSGYLVKTFIGFYNDIDNNFNYIVCSNDTVGTIMGITATLYTRQFLNNSVPFLDLSGNYTDAKENICTLTRVPYGNGFLSNLFLISTVPCFPANVSYGATYRHAGLINKFFSFNGRNFYCPFANYAVELPNN